MNKYEIALTELVSDASTLYVLHKTHLTPQVIAKRLDTIEECNNNLQELVKRATPMKPLTHFMSSLCPISTCKSLVSDEDNKYNFCPYCGQAIDWSGTNAK